MEPVACKITPGPIEQATWVKAQSSSLPPHPFLPALAAPKTRFRSPSPLYPPWTDLCFPAQITKDNAHSMPKLLYSNICNSRLKNEDYSAAPFYFSFFQFPPHHLNNCVSGLFNSTMKPLGLTTGLSSAKIKIHFK